MADYLSVANYLMMLSYGGHIEMENYMMTDDSSSDRRVFECKTCKRQFSSFQALGGHRASHKKPRIMEDELHGAKPKMHKCSICGVEFSIGQALGGHMRRHRDGGAAAKTDVENYSPVSSLSTQVVAAAEKSKTRGLDLDLDLNLTPLENNMEL